MAVNKKDFFFYALVLTGISYIFSMRLAIWSVPILFFAAVLQFDKWRFNKYYTGMLLFLVLLVFGGLYTSNTGRYFEILQRFLSFVLLPVIFMITIPLQKQDYKRFIKIFVYGVTLFHFINFLYALYRQLIITITKHASIDWYLFYRFDYVSLFHQHPTYVSMFSVLAIAFLLFNNRILIFSERKRTLILILLTFSMLLTGSRQGYFLMFLTYLIYTVFILKSHSNKFKIIAYFLTGLSVVVLLAYQVPIIKERINLTLGKKQFYKFYYKKKYDSKHNPEKEGRLLVWQDAFQIIRQNPVLGKGTGSDNDALYSQYVKNNHRYLIKKKYNAHNSYIQWLLNGGILLLTAYLLMLGQILFFAVKFRDPISFIFFMILFFVSFTETLYRVQGIIFIAFFYSFLLSLPRQRFLKNV